MDNRARLYKPMRARDLLAEGRAALGRAAGAEANLEAEVLLRDILDQERASFFASLDEQVTALNVALYHELLNRRQQGEPVAYILGYKEFYGREFVVNKGVLIPRPETELLVERAVKLLTAKGLAAGTLVDVGTGSGVIGLTLALELPALQVTAVDLSEAALYVAFTNRDKFGLKERVPLLTSDLLAAVAGPVDALVANLPYTILGEIEPAVLISEPWLALSGGGGDGFGLYRRFLEEAWFKLKPGGLIAAEIGYNQGSLAAPFARDLWPGARVEIAQDYAGHDRMLIVETEAE